MKLVGGDPCLDFVNTVGGRLTAGAASATRSVVRDDKLGSYDDLLAWARHANLLNQRDARELARLARRRPREASGDKPTPSGKETPGGTVLSGAGSLQGMGWLFRGGLGRPGG